MNIGISINTSWNIYNFRESLVKALLKEGHNVYAIAPEDKYSKIIEEWGCKFIPIRMSATSSNPIKESSLIFKYRRIIRNQKLDVLLTYTIKPNIYATIASRFTKCRVIPNVSGLGTVFLTRSLSTIVARMLYWLSFRNATFIFFQNKDDLHEFLEKIKINSKNIGLLPGSGINLSLFRPQPVSNNTSTTFLFIGRLIVEKGVNEYVKAASIVKESFPESKFIMVGKFDPTHSRSIPKSRLDRWSKELIIYHGESDDIVSEIKASDVVVLPSYREGKPRTLLEGAACARPLIATDVPGCRDLVIDGENGFLCSARSVESLAEAMIKFINLTESQKKAFGENSYKLVESEYDEKIVIDKYLSVINNITDH